MKNNSNPRLETSGGFYVYMIQKGYGSIKIGVAQNPELRLKTLQTGNHGELFLIAKFPCTGRAEAYLLEADLHKRFSNFRLKGEWFKKGILRELKHRSEILPDIFKPETKKGEKFNSYHGG